MNEDEKKDNSAPWINYRTDNAERELSRRRKAANEDSNKAKGYKQAEIGDAAGGEVKTQKEIIKEGEERKGKNFREKYTKTPDPRLLEKEVTKEAIFDKKDLHLKSSSALTEPETAKQNLDRATKLKPITNEPHPSRGNFRGGTSGRGGGFPMMREPDEMLKEKEKDEGIDPKDILSKKAKKENLITAMNSDKKPVIIKASDYTSQKKLEEPKKEPISKSTTPSKVISKSETKIFKPSKSEKPSPSRITNKVKR